MKRKEEDNKTSKIYNTTVTKAKKIRELFNIDDNKYDNFKLNKNLVIYNDQVFFNENVDNKEKITTILTKLSNVNQEGNCFRKESILKMNLNPGVNNPETIRKAGKSIDNSSDLNVIEHIFIPCINCNNLISYRDTEKHSLKCVKVKEEVLKLESSNYSFHLIDYRLKKLGEHINEQKKNVKETDHDILSSLYNYIGEGIDCQVITYNTVVSLKKIVSSIQESLVNFKGTLPTLILTERAKVIITQKINILREDLKKIHDTSKANRTKSGNLKESSDQEKDVITNPKNSEKESTSNNTLKSNDKNSVHSLNMSKVRNSLLHSSGNLNSPKKFLSEASEDERLTMKKQSVDINSEVEQTPIRAELSEGTSMNSISSFTSDISSPKTGDKRSSFARFGTNSNENLYQETEEKRNTIGIMNKPYRKDANYRDFVKLFLKTKFEKLDNEHQGQKISQEEIWQEVLKQNIPSKKWKEFILEELKNYKKYCERQKNRKYEVMDVIDEEN